MPPTLKIFAGKGITIKVTLTAKTPFTLFIPIDYNGNKFNSLDALRVIYKPFCVAGFYVIFKEISFGYGQKHSIIFIKNLHPVLQYMSNETQPVFQEIIK